MAEPPSRLLNLPRELRDNIYAYCTHDTTKTRQKLVAKNYEGGRKIQLQEGPQLSLLITCRQIFKEYRAVARKNVKLLVIDVRSATITLDLVLQPALQNITRLELRCLLICANCDEGVCTGRCGVTEEADHHTSFAKQLISQMPRLTTVHLKLDVWWPVDKETTVLATTYPQSTHTFKLSEKLANFSAISGVTSIEVTRRVRDGIFQPYAAWDKVQGWQGRSSSENSNSSSSPEDTDEESASDAEA